MKNKTLAQKGKSILVWYQKAIRKGPITPLAPIHFITEYYMRICTYVVFYTPASFFTILRVYELCIYEQFLIGKITNFSEFSKIFSRISILTR